MIKNSLEMELEWIGKMGNLTEREMEIIESTGLYIKSILADSQVEGYKIWDAVLKLQKISEMIQGRNITDEQLDSFLKVEEMKELIERFSDVMMDHLKNKVD